MLLDPFSPVYHAERRALSCRSHPKYILDRHITRYDMLKPNAQKIGLHRGEAFYLRADLAHLHTVRFGPPYSAHQALLP